MRVAYLIAGSRGMLGTALRRVLAQRAIPCADPPEASFDITDEPAVAEQVASFAASLSPGCRGVVVNAAAYTNVEAAEDEAERAYHVNEHGARILAAAAARYGLGFLHVSTDFVFDGAKDSPYVEDDVPNPLSVYGASKLAGERAVAAAKPDALIVRTAWAFGPGGANFPLKILAAARERGALSVVDDEIGSPTYTVDLAAAICELVEAGAPAGLYHLAGLGVASRYDLAVEVLRLSGVQVPVARAKAADYPSRAARPRNSLLNCEKAAAMGVVMPHWRDALARFVEDIAAQAR